MYGEHMPPSCGIRTWPTGGFHLLIQRLRHCPTGSSLAHLESIEHHLYRRVKRDDHDFFLSDSNTTWALFNWSESISTTLEGRTLDIANAMATPLKKVSGNYRLTLKRVRFATAFPPYDDSAEALSENDISPHAGSVCLSLSMTLADPPSHIIRGGPKFPAEAENGSKTPFTTFPLESILPPGLYTAIAHNGPLRRRIQDHSEELEEFRAHVRHAQRLVLGWLATLYHLIIVVVRHVLVCAVVFTSSRVDFTASLKGNTTRHLVWFHRLRTPTNILGMPRETGIKQGTSFPSCAQFGALFSKPVEGFEGTESEPSVEKCPLSAWRRLANNAQATATNSWRVILYQPDGPGPGSRAYGRALHLLTNISTQRAVLDNEHFENGTLGGNS